jgi:hypothetical protein
LAADKRHCIRTGTADHCFDIRHVNRISGRAAENQTVIAGQKIDGTARERSAKRDRIGK